MQLEELKGLGAKRLQALHEADIYSLSELLQRLPSSYQDTVESVPFSQVNAGETVCVEGIIANTPKAVRFHGKTSVTVHLLEEETSMKIYLTFFNQPWVAQQVTPGERATFYGRAERNKQGKLCMYCPARVKERAIIPVYKTVSSIPGKVMRDLIRQGLEQLESCCPETLPRSLRLRYGLCERNFALRQAHFPDTKENLQLALHRLAFEDALLYQAAAYLMRGERTEGVQMDFPAGTTEKFWQLLPFSPTEDQKKVLNEIASDLKAPYAMGRMVQGDVGCGKTAVALGAMYCADRAGYQSVLMAPTEILARQHLESAKNLLEKAGIPCGLLLGGMKTAERREALENIRTGRWRVVIGTHALLSEGVEYENLGLVITDEQHRFGVRQRKALSNKAQTPPNALVMSATPIPRTLALVLYGDLDLSVISQLPPGRTPVTTRLVPEKKREGLYRFIHEEAAQGRQTYLVCPMVDENETMELKSAKEVYAELCMGAFSNLRVGLTYGDQPPEEKEENLRLFAAGEKDVLVATTVIEVGVNVPSATVMVIENAERFGLSQLHQLRGRVGRGADQSWCFLMAEQNERLKTLCETNDGFVIAKKDLELRGPGEFLGTRQHGQSVLQGLSLCGDGKLLEETHRCLLELVEEGQKEEWEEVKAQAKISFRKIMDQVAMN